MDNENAEIGKEEEENMGISTANKSQVKLPPMDRMKKIAQEVCKKRDLLKQDLCSWSK